MQQGYGPEGRRAIANLVTLDQRKGRNLTNAQVMPAAQYVDKNQPAARLALRRTASFLLIRDVLQDIAGSIPCVMAAQDDPVTTPRIGMLVTAQLEALRQQVDIGMHDAGGKVQSGERILPLALRSQAFDHFMQAHTPTLKGIVESCTQVGAQRNHALEHYLKILVRNYLGTTDRLPSGLGHNEFFEARGMRFMQDSIGLRLVDYDFLNGTCFGAETNGRFGAMFIDPEDCSHPFGNPCEGGLDEQFYATGFEHCSIPQKQAAVLILKTFWEAIYLEVSVAEWKGKASTNMAEALLAQATELDRRYHGSIETGDFCEERGTDPANQRKELVDAARMLAPAVKAFSLDTGTTMVGDPDLDAWLQSPQFAKDMEGLKFPEFRHWLLGAASVKQALLRTSVFAKR